MLAVIPDIGILAALIGTPLLWAGYFLAIPEIDSHMARRGAVVLVALVHLGAGTWMATRDAYLPRMLAYAPAFTVFYFVLLVLSVVALGMLAFVARKPVRHVALP
jgi:hypothetical protein